MRQQRPLDQRPGLLNRKWPAQVLPWDGRGRKCHEKEEYKIIYCLLFSYVERKFSEALLGNVMEPSKAMVGCRRWSLTTGTISTILSVQIWSPYSRLCLVWSESFSTCPSCNVPRVGRGRLDSCGARSCRCLWPGPRGQGCRSRPAKHFYVNNNWF
jgi:hypothetical protein